VASALAVTAQPSVPWLTDTRARVARRLGTTETNVVALNAHPADGAVDTHGNRAVSITRTTTAAIGLTGAIWHGTIHTRPAGTTNALVQVSVADTMPAAVLGANGCLAQLTFPQSARASARARAAEISARTMVAALRLTIETVVAILAQTSV
jgi:hypothetical protein